MSDQPEQHEKTEEPTPKKLEDARQKGQVPVSKEVNHWFMLLAAMIGVTMIAPSMATDLGKIFRFFLESAHEVPGDAGAMGKVLEMAATETLYAMMPLMLLLIVMALGAGVLQNGVVFSAETIKPKLSKLSLVKGMKRLFSMKSVVEFVKGLLKIAIVGAIALLILWPEFGAIIQTVTVAPVELVSRLQSLAGQMVIAVFAVMTVITVADLIYSRLDHHKQQRMTRKEIKDEMKQTEGDPQVKGKLKQLRLERSRQRMMSKVPEADVVITNPTHYAVALKYDAGEMEAPRVLAKGVDKVAARIRAVAEENKIPLVENPALARALFATVDLDEEVPPEHYRAVAEIISYVMGLKGRLN